MSSVYPKGFKPAQAFIKRLFDIVVGLIILPAILPVVILLALISRFIHGQGIFTQTRIGKHGRRFQLHKICSMRQISGITTNVTAGNDPRITGFGRIIRKTKMDEFPQLWNVLKGEMSFVGPRPDVPETYDGLTGQDLDILSIRPGITGLGSLTFRTEETLLEKADDPEAYNAQVIFPQKIRINREYIQRQSILLDMKIMIMTVLSPFLKGS